MQAERTEAKSAESNDSSELELLVRADNKSIDNPSVASTHRIQALLLENKSGAPPRESMDLWIPTPPADNSRLGSYAHYIAECYAGTACEPPDEPLDTHYWPKSSQQCCSHGHSLCQDCAKLTYWTIDKCCPYQENNRCNQACDTVSWGIIKFLSLISCVCCAVPCFLCCVREDCRKYDDIDEPSLDTLIDAHYPIDPKYRNKPLDNCIFTAHVHGDFYTITLLLEYSKDIRKKILRDPTNRDKIILAALRTHQPANPVSIDRRIFVLLRCWEYGSKHERPLTELLEIATSGSYPDAADMVQFLWRHYMKSLPPSKREQANKELLPKLASRLIFNFNNFQDNQMDNKEMRKHMQLLIKLGLAADFFYQEDYENALQRQLASECMFNLGLALHPRVGAESALYGVFGQNAIGDRKALGIVKEFLTRRPLPQLNEIPETDDDSSVQAASNNASVNTTPSPGVHPLSLS